MKKLLLLWGVLGCFNTNAQVRLVSDINTGSASSNPEIKGVFNGRVILGATFGGPRFYLTDGTGVRMLRTTNNGFYVTPVDPANKPFVVLNNQLIGLFDYAGTQNGESLLTKCDGVTIDGFGSFANVKYSDTSYLGYSTDIQFGDAVVFNNKIIFASKVNTTSTYSDELIIADDVTGSTPLKDIFPGVTSSSPREMTVVGSKCYFSANNGTLGRELWETDGTTAGTVLFSDINAGITSSNPQQLKNYGTFLVFVATHPTLGRELFKINNLGTLTSLKNINPTGDSNPTNVTVIGSAIYFAAHNGTTVGNELWMSTGTSTSTNLVKDINPIGSMSSNPADFIENQAWVYFTADDGTNGRELWKTDGTTAGTTLVSNINPSGSSNPTDFVVHNGRLYFTADDGTGRQLYYVDASSVVHKIIINPSGDSLISGLTSTSTELFFAADAGTGIGKELYAFNDAVLATNDFQLAESQIKMYPNPTNSIFILETQVGINKVEIFSLQGQLIKTFLFQDTYDVNDLAKGIYVVKINTEEGTLNKNLAIE